LYGFTITNNSWRYWTVYRR